MVRKTLLAALLASTSAVGLRVSERQKKNPFLMAQAMKSMFYEEPIDTRWILHRLLRTADALIDNWSFHYGILEETDRERCYRDAMPVKALPSVEMSAAEELRIGGETVYKTVSSETVNKTSVNSASVNKTSVSSETSVNKEKYP